MKNLSEYLAELCHGDSFRSDGIEGVGDLLCDEQPLYQSNKIISVDP